MSRRHISLLYHDVVEGDPAESGFPGAAAGRYKLDRTTFERHLAAVAARQPLSATAIAAASAGPAFHITFDDGGASSPTIADCLERRGWIGHFFIATDWIGKPGFLDAEGIRALARRGHVVGSHSCSHPLRMASLSRVALDHEWGASRKVLSDILGDAPATASIPGGGYSQAVAEAAGRAGYAHLFTSEPSAAPWRAGDVTCLGRYSIVAATPPEVAAALAAGDWRQTTRLAAAWTAKRAIKGLIGPLWERAREHVLRAAPTN